MPQVRVRVAVLALALVSSAAAQQRAEIPLDQLLSEASASLKRQEFSAAAEVLELALKRQLPPAQAESVLFSYAGALFRMPDFARAEEALGLFIRTYPQSSSVDEAKMSRAICLALLERWKEAADAFREVESVPSLRQQALGYRAECALRAGDSAQAIEALEGLISLGVRDANEADTIFSLVQLYLEQGKLDRAEVALSFLRSRLDLVDNRVRLNAFTLQTADRRLESGQRPQALALYRQVASRALLMAEQRRLNEAMEARLRQAEALASTAPSAVDARNRLKARLELCRKLLAEIEGMADYDAANFFRMGRAFFEGGKPWEAILLFEEVVENHPKSSSAEPAMYALVRAYFDVNQKARALELSRRFQREFRDSKFADQIALLGGQVSFERQDFVTAATLFGEAAAAFPQSSLREQMLILLANSRFLAGEMSVARDEFKAYLQAYPEGQFREDAAYRIAMASFFSGDYAAAVTDLKAYLAANPEGIYTADAEYRLAVCSFSARRYDQALEETATWLSRHEGAVQTADVYSLRGDILVTLGRPDEAIEAYGKAIEATTADDVIAYAMSEITKIHQSRGDFLKIAELHEAFVTANPDSPLVPGSIYWIGRARTREGQAEEAARFIATNVGRFIADPKKEGVERMLGQLAQILSRRPRVPPGQPRPAPPTLNELIARLDSALGGADRFENNTARARLLLTQAELARLNKLPEDEQRLVDAVAEAFQPADLSAAILARVGMRLVEQEKFEAADPFLRRLISEFPKSEFADAGYVGLGEIALRRGDAVAALTLFREAVDKAGAQTRAKEATLGQARSLLELRRLDEAEQLFQQIAGSREWRGEATAQSIYSLGLIARLRNDLPAAQAHFQRVFVAYQRFLPWVAKAYLQSGETFEALGKPQEAAATYREFQRNERLANFPEATLIRQRLAAIDPT